MAWLLTKMVSASEHLPANLVATKAAGIDFFGRKWSANDFSNVLLKAKARLSDDDVTGVTVADVTNALALVNVTVQSLAADLVAVDWVSAFHRFLRFAARAGPEK